MNLVKKRLSLVAIASLVLVATLVSPKSAQADAGGMLANWVARCAPAKDYMAYDLVNETWVHLYFGPCGILLNTEYLQ